MIEKINFLLEKAESKANRDLCEKAISTLDSAIYKEIPNDARAEIQKVVVENLFKKLNTSNDKVAKKWLSDTKRIWEVQNLGVRESVNKILDGEARTSPGLKNILEQFKDLLESNHETLLYENFISAMQSFSYFPQVGNAIKAIKDRVDNYESDVSITKILETMKKTNSSYLVPLIEDLVQNYLDNKNMQTKSSLKEGLIKFSYDPFVRDLINLVSADSASLQLEFASALCDVERVYSPVIYLGENEAIFSVRGSYYIKKGNNLSRLVGESVKKLDPKFLALCEAINNPNVEITNKSITIYEGNDVAVIYKDSISLNGKFISSDQYIREEKLLPLNGKYKFMETVNLFNENFDEIAEIDFAKRVFLKENADYAADVFKLRGNISIATYDPKMGGGTFYRNINPIQAKNLMMEHLRFDVSKAFSDLLPNEEKINEEIEETKKAYSDYIYSLQSRIHQFSSISGGEKISKKVVQALKEELSLVNSEYKDYLQIVEKFKRPLNEASVTLEVNGPLTIDVNGQKYVIPMPQGSDTSSVGAQGQTQDVMGGINPPEADQFGTSIATDDMKQGNDSAITFNDKESELLSPNSSIDHDEVDLGSEIASADADAAEASAEISSEEGKTDETGEEVEAGGEEEGGSEEGSEEGSGLDLDFGSDEEDEEGGESIEDEGEEKEEKEEKKEKVEDSTSNREVPKKKRVYLKKKKI